MSKKKEAMTLGEAFLRAAPEAGEPAARSAQRRAQLAPGNAAPRCPHSILCPISERCHSSHPNPNSTVPPNSWPVLQHSQFPMPEKLALPHPDLQGPWCPLVTWPGLVRQACAILRLVFSGWVWDTINGTQSMHIWSCRVKEWKWLLHHLKWGDWSLSSPCYHFCSQDEAMGPRKVLCHHPQILCPKCRYSQCDE